jgi:hypothetical protein
MNSYQLKAKALYIMVAVPKLSPWPEPAVDNLMLSLILKQLMNVIDWN